MVTGAAERHSQLIQLQPIHLAQEALLAVQVVENPLTHLAVSFVDQSDTNRPRVVLIRQRCASKSCLTGCHCFGPYKKPREAELPGASLQHIV